MITLDFRVQDQYNVGVEKSFDVGRKNALVTGGFTGMLSLVAQGAIGLVVYEGALEVIKVYYLFNTLKILVVNNDSSIQPKRAH